MPRVKLTPTEEQRRTVRSFSAYGVEPDEIAKYIGVSEKTLQKYYGKDIFRARVEANLKVGKALFDMATIGEEPAAAIFWTKTRCGFHEKQNGEARPAAIPNFVVAQEKKAA